MTADAGTETASPPPSPDLAARWALVLPHQDRLRRIAARRLSCRDEVDDVVQEAMVRAVTFERLDPAYVGHFLSTVTVRLCADVQRDRVRQLRVGVRDALRSVEPVDPNDTLLDRAEARWLYAECLKLPPRESAVVLARASGMSVKETATSLGVGTKSAEAALTKARHRMRRASQSAGIAVLGVLKKLRLAGPPAAVAASVTVATVGGVVGVMLDDQRPSRRPPAVSAPAAAFRVGGGRAAAAPEVPEPVAAVTRAVRQAVAPPAETKPTVPPAPEGSYDFETPPLGDPKFVGTKDGVKGRETREDETFEETLVSCVGEVLTVDPHHLLCDPE